MTISPALESNLASLEQLPCAAPATCPLSQIRAGVAVRIKQLRTSVDVALRLREIGFGEEQVIKLVTASTNIICLVCNARLAISPQLAQSILVEPATMNRGI